MLIEDLGSTNGTFVNGNRIIHPRRLKDGDRIQLGTKSQMKFSVLADELVDRTVVDTPEKLAGCSSTQVACKSSA